MTHPVSALDQLEIQDLVTRYNHAIDRGDVETWLDCFTSDGAFDGVLGRRVGHEALRGFANELVSGPEGEVFRPMRHWTTNSVIDYETRDGVTARMCADHLLVRGSRDGVKLLLMAVSRDRLRRVDGGWCFSERVVELQGGTTL